MSRKSDRTLGQCRRFSTEPGSRGTSLSGGAPRDTGESPHSLTRHRWPSARSSAPAASGGAPTEVAYRLDAATKRSGKPNTSSVHVRAQTGNRIHPFDRIIEVIGSQRLYLRDRMAEVSSNCARHRAAGADDRALGQRCRRQAVWRLARIPWRAARQGCARGYLVPC